MVVDAEGILSGVPAEELVPGGEYEDFVKQLFENMVIRNNRYVQSGYLVAFEHILICHAVAYPESLCALHMLFVPGIGDGFGYLFNHGRPVRIKLLSEEVDYG